MPTTTIALRRLYHQGLSQQKFTSAAEVVDWMGAVQSQDYMAAKWALGLRLPDATDALIEQACTDGTILRTHVMRPTWHFVTPADIRWMQALTAPRVKATMTSYNRKMELDAAIFARSNAVIAQALQGGKQLTRAELGTVLQAAGIATDDLRLTFLMMGAELDAVICSGGRRGKQFTYALLDERAPNAKTLARDEALAELARRYFTSHGPATLPDFVWWSGLTVADSKAGLEMVKSQLSEEVIEGQTYCFAASTPASSDISPMAHLLPCFDEFTVSYTDRSAVVDVERTANFDSRDAALLNYVMLMDGRIVGRWKRTFKKDAVVVALSPLVPLKPAETDAFAEAAQRYGEFLGMSVIFE